MNLADILMKSRHFAPINVMKVSLETVLLVFSVSRILIETGLRLSLTLMKFSQKVH